MLRGEFLRAENENSAGGVFHFLALKNEGLRGFGIGIEVASFLEFYFQKDIADSPTFGMLLIKNHCLNVKTNVCIFTHYNFII